MSLRKQAKILGISPPYLSLLLNGKRPWRGDLKERYEELVNTFVNTQEANTTISNGPNGNSYLKSAGAECIQTPAPLLAKPRIDFPLASENVLESFINDKKNTKGLTISGEE